MAVVVGALIRHRRRGQRVAQTTCPSPIARVSYWRKFETTYPRSLSSHARVLLRCMSPNLAHSGHFAATQHFGRFRSEADIEPLSPADQISGLVIFGAAKKGASKLPALEWRWELPARTRPRHCSTDNGGACYPFHCSTARTPGFNSTTLPPICPARPAAIRSPT